ncbi:effector-binding domain-containing protein [Flavobacterium glycines]|uniref:Effector-binding domain-containing protein n=1 Tax=Flavobacterium glycines TaxID=551990 RepID=A0A1B9DY80_9FLAO|nr:SRPBCC family protein [Flavobacterium glycines]OCB74639.1 transcriptional regulator [Flavobacterium glycines]SDJ08730.1 effector-binding domain-containing protein [Flavobacterium glycines]
MRIIKYIFLLLLLSLVALSIFIATQKGDFLVERSKIINSPKTSVYNYVNDYRNWSDFGSWITQDAEIKLNYSQNTVGKGASFSWEGKDGNGETHTISVKENDSINQTTDFEGTSSKMTWRFKDTIGGTKVTWITKGKMSFFFKIYTALNGGVDKVIGTIYEKSLVNLDKALDYEINTFTTKENGIIQKPIMNYIGQTFTSEIAKVNKNFKIVIPKLTTFCKKNNITVNGKPFIIYHTYDVPKGLTRITIGLGIRDAIFLSSGSDMVAGKLDAFEGAKTTLIGDYSHLKTAYNKTINYLNQNKIAPNPIFSFLEIYSTGKNDVKNPSKWTTEVYIPIVPKVIPQEKTINTAIENNTTPEAPKIEETSEF